MRRFIYTMLFLVTCAVFSLSSVSAAGKGDAAKGKETFQTTCAACHGAEGKGDGVAAQALDPKPRNLSDAAIVSALTDEHLYKVISEGGAAVGLSPMMAAWGGTLSEQDIW
ncbi:MAG: c-type cytochrome, partial [Thermodesulfobacteriota bacterium]